MRTRRILTFALLLATVFGLAGLHRATAADAKTLVIGLSENSTSLDPARGYEQETSIVHKAAYDTLVTFPPDNVSKILPSLATSWTISPDGLTYTFTLKDGVMFSTGNPMTSADVVFSWNRAKNIKGNPSSLAANFASVTAPDAKTVVLKLKQPDPSTLAILVFGAFSVMDSKTVKANGGTDAVGADKTDKAETWLDQNSAGTGPYILTAWNKGSEIDLVNNPKYWGATAPNFTSITLLNIPNAAVQKDALSAGDIDVALDITPDQVAGIQSDPNLKVYQGPNAYVFFLLMNENKAISGPMSNPKVQQAVRLALDYQGILKLEGGAAVQPASVIPVGFADAFGPEKALKQDVPAATKLMSDAGQSAGFSIDMEYWDTTYAGVDFGTLAQKIQADLKAINITVNLKPGTLDVTLGNYRDGKESLGMWFWGPDYQDPQDYLLFLPDQLVGKRANWTKATSDATIQGLYTKAATETDPAKRADLFSQIQTYLQQNGPFAPFLQPGIQVAYRSNVSGMAWNYQWNLDPAAFSKQ